MNNAGQFYTNRVLKDWKEKSKVNYVYFFLHWQLLLGCLRDEDPVLAKKNLELWPCTSNEGRFIKVYRINIFESLLFCFHSFGVRRTKDVLDS